MEYLETIIEVRCSYCGRLTEQSIMDDGPAWCSEDCELAAAERHAWDEDQGTRTITCPQCGEGTCVFSWNAYGQYVHCDRCGFEDV